MFSHLVFSAFNPAAVSRVAPHQPLHWFDWYNHIMTLPQVTLTRFFCDGLNLPPDDFPAGHRMRCSRGEAYLILLFKSSTSLTEFLPIVIPRATSSRAAFMPRTRSDRKVNTKFLITIGTIGAVEQEAFTNDHSQDGL